jgi:hypothetical protein
VDEFDQAKARGEANDRPEVPGCLFASEGDAFEALEPSDALLDAGAGLVEGACKEGRLVLFVGLVRDDRRDAALSRRPDWGCWRSLCREMTARGWMTGPMSSRVSK